MNLREHGSVIRLGFWAVVLFSVFAWAPTTYPGYWQALDGFRPVFNAVRPGAVAGVAIQPDLWRGSGSAAYLIAQPLMLIGLSPVAAVRATFAIAIVLGGLGMYVWLRERWGDRAAGLAGLLFMLWPPLLATIYVRGSLSDAVILGLLPLAFAGIAIYADHGRPSAVAVIALTLIWMWRTQAGLAAAASLLLLAYALFVERSRLASIVVALSAAAGFTSLLSLWSVRAPSTVDFFEHFVYPHQLLYGVWTVAPSIPGWQDAYPFQLGISVLAFGAIGLWLWLTQRQTWHATPFARMLAFAGIGAFVLILLSLPISSPLWRITRADPLFTYPWQLLLLAGPLLVLVAASLPVTAQDLGKPVLWTVLVGLIMLGSLPYLTTEFTQTPPPSEPRALFGRSPNIALLDARVIEDTEEQTAQLDVTWQTLEPLPFDYNVFFQALPATADSQDVIAQLDVQPLQGERPATAWLPGQIFTDTYTLDLSEAGDLFVDDGPGLRYYFGYYDWRDGSRLPVGGGIDDKLILFGERR